MLGTFNFILLKCQIDFCQVNHLPSTSLLDRLSTDYTEISHLIQCHVLRTSIIGTLDAFLQSQSTLHAI